MTFIVKKDIEELLKNNLAHIKDGNKETIKEHADLCIKYFNIFENHLLHDLNNIYNKYKDFLEKMIYLHDIGKLNPRFQSDKMKIKNKDSKLCGNSSHSKYSAYLYFAIILNEINSKEKLKLNGNKDIYYILNFAYLISRHHTYLKELKEDGIDGKNFIQELQQIENEKWIKEVREKLGILSLKELFKKPIYETLKNYLNRKKINDFFETQNEKIDFYIKNKIAYSLLITCDFTSAYEFFKEEEFQVTNKLNPNKYFNGDMYNLIITKPLTSYASNDINKLRSQMALEVKENIEKTHINKSNIFQLEMPCGAGKTNTSLMSSMLLLNKDDSKRGIIYTSPFNAIIDQNVSIFKKYFDNVQVMNSTTDINFSENEDDDESDIEQLILNYQTNNIPFICTSHVHFFDNLFGITRESALGLIFLSNRIIIMDEIQGYDPKLWKIMMSLINRYSKILNFDLIIMSATMPSFEDLVQHLNIIDLLPNKKIYFDNPLFKNRFKFEYIGQIKDFKEILEKDEFYNNKKILYEFQTKKVAGQFFEFLKNNLSDKNIELLTGDNNKFERIRIINKAKTDNQIIIISTQVIEAGVDLDFDFGWKEISIPDSEQQFGGRINRSCKKIGGAKFFKYKKNSIYNNDPRSLVTMEDPKIQEALKNFDNNIIYEKTLEYIEKDSSIDSSQYNFEELLNKMILSEYKKIAKLMKLIEETDTLFVAYNLKITDIDKDYKNELINFSHIDELKDIIEISPNNIVIDGKKLWKLIEKLNNDKINFAKKFLLMKKINILKSYFSFSVDMKGKSPSNIEQVGNRYYYTEDSDYIINGCLNREKLNEKNRFW